MNPRLAMQIARYLAGGLTTTVLTWSCVWLFVEIFHFHYLISINLATGCAYGYSYLVNKLFVFRQGRRTPHKRLKVSFLTNRSASYHQPLYVRYRITTFHPLYDFSRDNFIHQRGH